MVPVDRLAVHMLPAPYRIMPLQRQLPPSDAQCDPPWLAVEDWKTAPEPVAPPAMVRLYAPEAVL